MTRPLHQINGPQKGAISNMVTWAGMPSPLRGSVISASYAGLGMTLRRFAAMQVRLK